MYVCAGYYLAFLKDICAYVHFRQIAACLFKDGLELEARRLQSVFFGFLGNVGTERTRTGQ